MSSAAPLQQATANSHSEARNPPRQLRQNSAVPGRESQSNFADSRPQTAIQRRLRETAANSPQTAQLLALQRMAAASEHTNQLKAMISTASAAALQRVEDEEPLQAKFASIQRVEEEEPLQGKFNTAQRVEEDEPLQNKLMTAQRVEDEELLQGKFAPVQRVEENEPLQGKFNIAQRVEEDEPLQNKLMTAQRVEDEELLQGKFDTVQRQEQVAARPNNTGLPNQLKSGIESLSGMSMDHVKVHYNSSQPAQLNALAYAQGSDIHVAPVQEQHLPHEAWHVVQQAQGRVKPTMQMKDGVPVNDDAGLETEADVMGAKALQLKQVSSESKNQIQLKSKVIQRIQDFDFSKDENTLDENDEHSSGTPSRGSFPKKNWLTGTTESNYESKITPGTNRYNFYWSDFLGESISGSNKPIQQMQETCQLRLINRRDGGGVHDYVYALGPNNNIDFSNNLGIGGNNPVVGGTNVDLTTGCLVANHGVTLSGMVVPLSPNAGGTRARHFSIADRINPGAAAIRPGQYTWHHNDLPYTMELVDSNIHNPGYGGFFHWGGMAFWP